MIDMRTRVMGMTDRQAWARRGATFVTKAKATKAVWFPPKTSQAGKKTTARTRKSVQRATAKGAKRAS